MTLRLWIYVAIPAAIVATTGCSSNITPGQTTADAHDVATISDTGSGDGASRPGPDGAIAHPDSGSESGTNQDSGPQTNPDAAPINRDPCVALGTCPPNTWVNVTPPGIVIPDPGLRAAVVDPLRPSDIYMGGGTDAGIWKSTDYGNTWTLLNQGFGYDPQGLVFAIAQTTPPTIYITVIAGNGRTHKSTDGGATFQTVGNGGLPSDLYSIVVDPQNPNHLVSGLHEADGIVESTDAGVTWHLVGTTGFPTGGVSWFPFFMDDRVPFQPGQSWIAIAQNSGSPVITHDGGTTWTIPQGLQGLVHPHGHAQIFQRGSDIFVPGTGGPSGSGVYRSTDSGATFTRATADTNASISWGTPNHVYSMFGWSCFGCPIDPNFQVGNSTGEQWVTPGVPAGIMMSPDRVAVTFDGEHYVFVGAMKNSGLWRYREE